MATSAQPLPAVRAALSGLIDYAGLFLPAQLPMTQAVSEYASYRDAEHAWMLGRFIVPLSRIDELATAISGGRTYAASAILDGGIPGLECVREWRARPCAVTITSLEVVLEPEQIERFAAMMEPARCTDLPAFVEIAQAQRNPERLRAAMETLAQTGLNAKIRCGGTDAAAFPSVEEVARFLFDAHQHRVAFKATAGLHHPVRRFDADTGAWMHGFLNVVAAAVLARAGETLDVIAEALACEDPSRFTFDANGMRVDEKHIDTASIQAMRRDAFLSYGSCSFHEPVDDLHALQLV